MSSPPRRQEAEALLSALTRALAGVAVLAAVFTAVNVTGFAVAHKVPLTTAVLLDPMVALALATVLLADARLASWGVPPPGWSAALRWFTGTTATVMNTWTSIWPDDRIGWPRHADPAGVLLHSVPPVLLILLTETVAAYRHRITALKNTTPPPLQSSMQERSLPAPVPESAPCGNTVPPGAPPTTPTALTHPDHGGPHGPGNGPDTAPTAQTGQAGPSHAAVGDVFIRALRLDAEHRSRTGGPMSIRQLKRALRVGHARAKSLRYHLETHHTATAPHPGPAPATAPEGHSPGCSQTPLHQEG